MSRRTFDFIDVLIFILYIATLAVILNFPGQCHAAIVQIEQSCSIQTVCKPLHPKPRKHRPAPQRLDLMCYEFNVSIVLQMPTEIPLTINLPPDIMPPDVDDTPEPEPQVPAPQSGGGSPGSGGGGGWFGWAVEVPTRTSHIGAPGLPTLPAPEIDPDGVLGAMTLLLGAVVILRGRK